MLYSAVCRAVRSSRRVPESSGSTSVSAPVTSAWTSAWSPIRAAPLAARRQHSGPCPPSPRALARGGGGGVLRGGARKQVRPWGEPPRHREPRQCPPLGPHRGQHRLADAVVPEAHRLAPAWLRDQEA